MMFSAGSVGWYSTLIQGKQSLTLVYPNPNRIFVPQQCPLAFGSHIIARFVHCMSCVKTHASVYTDMRAGAYISAVVVPSSEEYVPMIAMMACLKPLVTAIRSRNRPIDILTR
jgi:hypothetical protein